MNKIETWFKHIPTGWVYYRDPDCPILMVNQNSGNKVPLSFAVFPGQQDWVRYVPEQLFVDENGELICH